MPLGIHLGREVAPFLILALTVLVDEQSHRFNRESQQCLGTFLVEPLHETLLQPRETIPVGLRTIGEIEFTEDALEVILVIVGHIPEHSLIVAGTSGLIQRVHNLLEVVGDNLVDGALLQRQVGLLVRMLPIVLAILVADEIVHVHQELWCGTGARKHRTHHEHHVDKTAGKRL